MAVAEYEFSRLLNLPASYNSHGGWQVRGALGRTWVLGGNLISFGFGLSEKL